VRPSTCLHTTYAASDILDKHHLSFGHFSFFASIRFRGKLKSSGEVSDFLEKIENFRGTFSRSASSPPQSTAPLLKAIAPPACLEPSKKNESKPKGESSCFLNQGNTQFTSTIRPYNLTNANDASQRGEHA
jgi:hypothetical protein